MRRATASRKPRNLQQLVQGCLPYTPDRTEMLNQCPLARRADTFYGVQRRSLCPFAAQLPVISQGNAVRFISSPLQKVNPGRVSRQTKWVRLLQSIDLFQAFRQPYYRQIIQTQLKQDSAAALNCPRPPSINTKSGIRANLALVRASSRVSASSSASSSARADYAESGVAQPHACSVIIRTLYTSNAESSVVRRKGFPVLQDDHRRHCVSALQIGNIKGLDTLRQVCQSQDSLQLLQACLVMVLTSIHPFLACCQHQAGIFADHLHQAPFFSSLGSAQINTLALLLA